MKKLNKKLIAGIGLGALAVVGGTFAYYQSSASLDNPLSTGKYQNQLVEDFTPPTEDLKPGQKWEKKVGAENTGDYPVLVRIKMDEYWTRKDPNKTITDVASDNYKHILSVAGTKDAPQKNNLIDTGTFAEDKFTAVQISDVDGLTPEGDGTVVYKNLLEDSGWVDGNDGYWYWNGVLEKGGKTNWLMDNLYLATNIDLGEYEDHEYYKVAAADTDPRNITEWDTLPQGSDVNDDGVVDIRDYVYGDKPMISVGSDQKLFRKSESNIVKGKEGYADSIYTLRITSEFVQATKDAVDQEWGNVWTTLSNVNSTNNELTNN